MSKELTIGEKLNIIGNEYNIPIIENLREDVSIMCNLSQGIKEDGIAIGEIKKEANIILNMYKKGFSIEQIALATDKEINDIKTILEENEHIPI